jgi:hypothetical protein
MLSSRGRLGRRRNNDDKNEEETMTTTQTTGYIAIPRHPENAFGGTLYPDWRARYEAVGRWPLRRLRVRGHPRRHRRGGDRRGRGGRGRRERRGAVDVRAPRREPVAPALLRRLRRVTTGPWGGKDHE